MLVPEARILQREGQPQSFVRIVQELTLLVRNVTVESMEVTIQIPDSIAARLNAGGSELSRRALEGFALEELRAGRITEPQLREMLGPVLN